jgi:hypothetical protein
VVEHFSIMWREGSKKFVTGKPFGRLEDLKENEVEVKLANMVDAGTG